VALALRLANLARMADDETLSRLEIAAEEIAQIHGTGVQTYEGKDGRWIVSIENEDKGAVTGTGFSLAQALSDLIAEAKATGWAT
jgi:hypothetical protein